ncbi:MAG: hypothetical protein ACO3PB_04355, partial [Miltoncostaeaceae bacterium]
MRNLIRAALLAALIAPAAATALGPPPTPSGTSWLLVDGQTGEVLAERDADTARPMASTTKMMTALVALESGEEVRADIVVSNLDPRRPVLKLFDEGDLASALEATRLSASPARLV